MSEANLRDSTMHMRRMVAIVLLVLAGVMLFLAYQCISTEMYRLYSQPYQGESSRYEYFLKEAERKKAEADAAAEQGQEAIAVSYANIAANWKRNADEAGSYLTQHRTGAAALLVCSLLFVMTGIHMLVSRKKTAVTEP